MKYLSTLFFVFLLCTSCSGKNPDEDFLQPPHQDNAEGGDEKPGELPGDYDPEKNLKGITVKFLGYNVGAFSKYMDNSIPMVAKMVQEAGVDVVGMNETDSCTTRSKKMYQAKSLATAVGAGWNYYFSESIPYQGGKYGNSIISTPGQKIVKRVRRVHLPSGGKEQRSVGIVEYENFIFCVTHLDHTSNAIRVSQVEYLNEWIRKNLAVSEKPIFLCGDMNAEPGEESMEILREYWKQLTPNAYTFPSGKPVKCIDYFFVYTRNLPSYKVKKAGVLTYFSAGDVKQASDHLPVYLEVEL